MTGDVVKTTRLKKNKTKNEDEERVRCVRSTGGLLAKPPGAGTTGSLTKSNRDGGARSFGGIAAPERRTVGYHKRDAARARASHE